MRLYLSNSSVSNTVFSDAYGQALFMVQTPSTFSGRATDIFQRIAVAHPEKGGSSSSSLHFGHLANYRWHSWHSSRLRYRGLDVETRAFFAKDRWSVYGRDRVFTAPDGRQYRWEVGRNMQLRLNDGKRNPVVARFHSGHGGHGLFGVRERPWLDVSPSGEHILDTIVVTFVYIERLRRDE